MQGQAAGSWGAVGILSFGGSKLLTAGRGGAIITDRADIHQRTRLGQFRGNTVGPLSELQAVVLAPQLERLREMHIRRLANVAYLRGRLHNQPGLRLFANHVEGEPAYYKVGFQFDEAVFGLSRLRFVQAMRAEGIAVDEGFAALHVGQLQVVFARPVP